MRKGIYVIAITLASWILPTVVGSPSPPYLVMEEAEGYNPYLSVWEAVKFHESRNNCFRINWEEMAYGPGQIRQCKLDEYNNANGTHYTLQDCFVEEISREIFMWHCMKYNSIETAVKRWNGSGPATEIYWNTISVML